MQCGDTNKTIVNMRYQFKKSSQSFILCSVMEHLFHSFSYIIYRIIQVITLDPCTLGLNKFYNFQIAQRLMHSYIASKLFNVFEFQLVKEPCCFCLDMLVINYEWKVGFRYTFFQSKVQSMQKFIQNRQQKNDT